MFDINDVFASLKKYQSAWTQEGEPQSLNAEQLAMFKSAKVVDGEYSPACEFTTVDGMKMFLTMDKNSWSTVGDSLDLTKIKLVKLVKEGNKPIYRVLG